MRVYLGYPLSFSPKGEFKLKDNFLREVNCNYSSIPVEVKKKLLSLLENISQKDYIFLDGISYDGIDLLEFSLFPIEKLDVDEVVVPGYLYGKQTYLIRELFKKVFNRKVTVLYDFNFFDSGSIVINVGYTRSSISLGGKLLSVVPIGEFHFVDIFGNYLFNRTIGELGISNAKLRKEGIRGELLDSCRASAARILFGRSDTLSLPQLNYRRTVPKGEVEKAISPILGSARYGDVILSLSNFSSIFVKLLYTYEEIYRERLKVSSISVIGRLRWPFIHLLKTVFPIPVNELSGKEFLNLKVENRHLKVDVRNFSLDRSVLRLEEIEEEPEEISLESLRYYFNKRDLKGVKVIEELSKGLSKDSSFVYELLNIVKRCFATQMEDIFYLNASIAALSHLDLNNFLFKKVQREMENKAFDWQLPFETKINILYFCYKNREKLNGTPLSIFPYLMVTYIRNRKVSEGEKNFVRTVAEEFFKLNS
ncbi:hypothetical protein SAMN06269117_102102 [Balnearium lithotrophicum]|uniref:Uncharacterized protein n=1 Tax=Balnearium lithotrophicum TaxID=223788 RepID=A0A521ASI8_9BACT|nr:hypothetical protein [Balnearium lithotrophicum]SMO37745.1 hypothetical protein SAMN06269117_102102 [Balnearium lithotrophicum]